MKLLQQNTLEVFSNCPQGWDPNIFQGRTQNELFFSLNSICLKKKNLSPLRSTSSNFSPLINKAADFVTTAQEAGTAVIRVASGTSIFRSSGLLDAKGREEPTKIWPPPSCPAYQLPEGIWLANVELRRPGEVGLSCCACFCILLIEVWAGK